MATTRPYTPKVLPTDWAGTFDHLVAHGHIVNQAGKHVRLYQQLVLSAILYGPTTETKTPLHIRQVPEYNGFRQDVFDAVAPYVQKRNAKPDPRGWDHYAVTDWVGFNRALWPLIATRRVHPKVWSDAELKATIDAYQWMLDQQQAAKRFSKAKINAALRERTLSSRSQGSIEFRMRNISAVMEGLNRPVLTGYLPAKHTGEAVRKRITKLLLGDAVSPTDFESTADEGELDRRAFNLIKSAVVTSKPAGNYYPKKTTSVHAVIERDPKVKAWVLQEADGQCDCCDEAAPFVDDRGLPFLEVHHVVRLCDDGPDTPNNAVAVCPNCHRALHHSNERKKLIDKLLSKIERLRE